MVEIEDLTEENSLSAQCANEVKGLMKKVFGNNVTIYAYKDMVSVNKKSSFLHKLIYGLFQYDDPVVSFYSMFGSGDAWFTVHDPKYLERTRQVAEEYEKSGRKAKIRIDYFKQSH